jgi:hypothetical protein
LSSSNFSFFLLAPQPPVGQGFLIIDASRSHSDTTHAVGLLWTSDQPDAQNSTWQHTTLYKKQTSLLAAGFETAIPSSERPQPLALDRAATGVGRIVGYHLKIFQNHNLWSSS